MVSLLLCGALLLSLAACGAGREEAGPAPEGAASPAVQVAEPAGDAAGGRGYAVSSSSTYATDAAVQILEAGGNAVDAAVALAYTLAVVEPYASGLGGGGCMVLYDPGADAFVYYDYAAEAPRSGASTAILVPGFVSGMEAVRSDYGTMPLAELLRPAIACCDGVEVNRTLAARIDAAADSLDQEGPFVSGGTPMAEGNRLVQPELRRTLELLAEEGPDAFYTGPIAEEIAAATAITLDDLAGYETLSGPALVGSYQGYAVASAPAPFSGATLIQMLEMAELLDIPSPEADAQAFLEQLRRITVAAHRDRLAHVFDLRFGETDYTQAETVELDYLAGLLRLEPEAFAEEDESEDTSAFTVIDEDGLVVSCTNTLASFFGGKVVAGGFFLNNSGRNFGSGVNACEPGKRPRTHIAPVILRAGEETIAAATPGGNVIVKVLAQVLMDILQFGTPPEEAIAKQRLVFRTADQIYYEIGYDTPPLVPVAGSGYDTLPYDNHSYFGNLSYSSYSPAEGFRACADGRREGAGRCANG